MLSVDQEKGKAVFPVTVVKDGEGGFRIIQIWLQKDKDPGLVWYKIPKERVAEEPNYTIRFINSIFGNPKVERILLPEMFKDASSCQVWWRSEQLKSVCESYMIPEIKSQRDTAIQKWISSGIIPQEIQNGELEFFCGTPSCIEKLHNSTFRATI